MPNGLHGVHRRTFLEGHGPPPQWAPKFYRLDKAGELLPWIVAQQGHLHKCPHLAGVPLPRWPQVTPSESCQELQMKADTQTTSSSEPNAGATAAPVMEAPVTETPVTETPVMETPLAQTPAVETPVAETPAACSNTPAPMETGGAGEGQS